MDTAIARPELLLVADAVAREKSIEREEVLEAMEQAIQKAGRAKYGHEKDIRATIDRRTGDVRLSRWTEIVETVENEETQIPVHIAKRFKPDSEVGQFIVDPPRTPFDYHFSLTYLVAKRPGINPPTSLASKEFDWRKGWSDSWSRSQEGQAYLNTLHHWFVKPDPDGKFRISGVPPGDYTLAINLYGTTEGCLVNPIAQRVLPISILSDKPIIDLGRVVVPTHSSLQVGDVAANFDFKSPDGKRTDLTSQRGHYVLIDFWATWCGPCVANLPEVEALRKDFSTKGLVVVGANLDTEPATANEFLAAHPLPWHHAHLGDWSATTIPKQYGVSTVPAYILIDPQGRIATIEYSSDKIREYLEKQPPKAASSKTGD